LTRGGAVSGGARRLTSPRPPCFPRDAWTLVGTECRGLDGGRGLVASPGEPPRRRIIPLEPPSKTPKPLTLRPFLGTES